VATENPADELDLSLQRDDVEHIAAMRAEPKLLRLDPKAYPGGIAIWGALPSVYDTSACPVDEGVHVHARVKVGGAKAIDETFDMVEVQLDENSAGRAAAFVINGDDAAQFNTAAILKRRLKYLRCPECRHVHSDKLWNAVHYHTQHVCEHCQATFDDIEPGISNPLMLLKELCRDVLQDRPINDPVQRRIPVRQARFPGGIQLWGSNPAIIWTSPKLEEGGIHFHGFNWRTTQPTVDETFGRLDIDGIHIDPQSLRCLMAQQALSYLVPDLTTLTCPQCRSPHFDTSDQAIDPHDIHICEHCQTRFASAAPCVSNPLVAMLPGYYHVFQQLFPDVTLTPRFPWDTHAPAQG
jgi:Zn finger protein HypA/HybF involved in hydrogenase expression